MRRPNLTALLLSTAIVAAGLIAALHWHPRLQGMGFMHSDVASSAAARPLAAPAGQGCREERRVIHGGYRFLPDCAGQAPSPDGRYLVVKNSGRGSGVGLVAAQTGASLDDLGMFDDGQPFTIFWAPDSRALYVNHRVTGGTERLRVFALADGRLSESRALDDAAGALLLARRACLQPQDVAISGIRWSRDARRVAVLAYARRAACNGMGNWRPLWMIGDPVSGRIDPGSVRGRPSRAPLPADGPYATL